MGNSVLSRGHDRVKLMMLDGQVVKIKVPVIVDEVLSDYPGHEVLHSEAVRSFGVRAKPLDGCTQLNPKHLYFVVELPKLENYINMPRIVRSGIVNAKYGLENLLLLRRPVCDISIISSSYSNNGSLSSEEREDNGVVHLKLRLTKAQLVKMMLESQDSSQIAKKLLESCLKIEREEKDGEKHESALPWKPGLGSIPESCKSTEVI